MKGIEGDLQPDTTKVYSNKEGAAEKEPDLIKVGDTVRVLRSSGEQEDGWGLVGFDQKTGGVLVKKMEGNQILTKEVSQLELYAMNRPKGNTKKFSQKEWIDLWNSTGLDTNKIIPEKKDDDIMLTPEEARQILPNQERTRLDIRKAAIFKNDEEATQALQRRMAFFGHTDSGETLLRFFKGRKRPKN